MTDQPQIEDLPPDQIPKPEGISDGIIAAPTGEERTLVTRVEAGYESGTSTLGHAAVVHARTQIGVKEDPMGSNCGIPHDRYVVWVAGAGTPCVPWCAYFVGWAFDTSDAGNHDHAAPWGKS